MTRAALLLTLALFLTLAACAGTPPGSGNGGGKRVMVYRCPDGFGFVAELRSDLAWLFLPGRTIRLPRVAAAPGERFADAGYRFHPRGEQALLETPTGSHPGCRNDPRQAVWEKAKLDGVDFRAVGNEPGWYLEIRDRRSILLVTDYGTRRHLFAGPVRTGDRRAPRTRYLGRSGDDRLEVILEPGPCSDTMADETYETRVTVSLNGRLLRGCGKALH